MRSSTRRCLLSAGGGLLLLCSLSLAAPAYSARRHQPPAKSSARQVEHAFEARYRHASTLKAAFYERYSSGQNTGVAESGTVYFSRPKRMRWEYESPQKKLFIVDGTNVWFYIPEDHTASRAKLKQSSDWRTPLALLAGNADLNRICKNVELVPQPPAARPAGSAEDAEPGGSVLRCIPRAATDEAGQSIRDVLLTVDPQGYLVRVLIEQPGNITTEFRFGNWQENIHIAEVKFHFQPPPGVEIVDQDKLAGDAY